MGFKSTIINIDLEEPNKIRGGRVPTSNDDSWIDPDFGYMTKERREELLKAFNYLKSLTIVDNKGLGKIMVFGTGTGEDKSFEHLRGMFYNPDNYKIVDFNEEEDQL